MPLGRLDLGALKTYLVGQLGEPILIERAGDFVIGGQRSLVPLGQPGRRLFPFATACLLRNVGGQLIAGFAQLGGGPAERGKQNRTPNNATSATVT